MEFFEDKYDNMEGFSLQMKKLPAREAGIYALYPGVNLDNTLDFYNIISDHRPVY